MFPSHDLAVADLGLQSQLPYKGKEKPPVHKIAITYEFVDEFMKDEDGNDREDKPRQLTEIMPVYQLSAEKAKSTARYHALDSKGEYGGDFAQLTDIPSLVTVVHNPNPKTGGVYENIANVAAMREKDAEKCPPLKNAPVVFDFDNPD